jgi:hypothetical protein
MDKLIQLISDVRALRAVIVALASALVTGTGVLLQQQQGGGAVTQGHAEIIGRVDSVARSVARIDAVAADVAQLESWRQDTASAVLTSLMCSFIAENDGLDSKPCEMLCPPQVRRDIRALLSGGRQR